MFDESGGALVVTIGLFILLAIAITTVVVVRVRRRDAERSAGAIPLIVFPDADKPAGLPPRPRTRLVDPREPAAASGGPVAWGPPAAAAPPSAPVAGAWAPAPAWEQPVAGAPAPVAPPAVAPRAPVVPPAYDGAPSPNAVPQRDGRAPATATGNGTVVEQERLADGTLQFLPGRLEVLEGQDAGQEIRFVRSGPRTEITFGRSEGPRYKHVQFREQTVSRLHARLSNEGSRWHLANLSRTNPLYVNGAPLDPSQPSVVLADGDRIEMGEVVLRFRSH